MVAVLGAPHADVGERLQLAAPAMAAELEGQAVPPRLRVERNVALHSAGVTATDIPGLSLRDLNRVQRSRRRAPEPSASEALATPSDLTSPGGSTLADLTLDEYALKSSDVSLRPVEDTPSTTLDEHAVMCSDVSVYPPEDVCVLDEYEPSATDIICGPPGVAPRTNHHAARDWCFWRTTHSR